jgi:hypothetical protein
MNNKAITLVNTLSLVVAIAGAIFLVFFISKFSSNISLNTETKIAQNQIDVLTEKLNRLEINQENEFQIQSPTKNPEEPWFLIGWSKTESNRPNKCFLSGCLCFCKQEPGKELCEGTGFCRDLDDENIITEYNYLSKSNEGTFVDAGGAAHRTQSTKKSISKNIPLTENLISIEVEKQSNKIILRDYSDDFPKD